MDFKITLVHDGPETAFRVSVDDAGMLFLLPACKGYLLFDLLRQAESAARPFDWQAIRVACQRVISAAPPGAGAPHLKDASHS